MADSVRFQHYEVLRREDGSLFELGRGAMGITYKAFDTNLRTPVALKVINANYLNSDIARQRFLREARAAAAIRHPNVATVFHLGNEDDTYFYAMEFIDGETVEAYMQREGAVPTVVALEIAAQVARALAAAEKQGLVHRDIKPSNLMLVRDDGELTVKVIDFGLAKAADKEAGDTATLTMGGFLGTPHFASPEQLEERELDTRSDIYSLGVTLYYMLAGRTPFSGSLAQVMSQHLHREPPLELVKGQPPQVLALLERMMAKNPDDRPQTPGDLRREIEACVEAVKSAHSGVAGGAPAETTEAETITDAPREPSALILAPGVRLAERLELLEECKPGEHGQTFRAKDYETGEIVAVLILDPGLLPTSQAYTRLENEVTAIQAVKHPAVIRVHGLERAHHITFLTREWVEGPSLLDAMRQRGGLPAARAMEILAAIAGGLDAVQRTGVPCPELAASWITLAQDAAGAAQPKFNALNFSAVAPHDPDATLVSAPLSRGGTATGDRYITGIAALAYQMLGGMHAGHETFVPIAGISEEANLVLRRALKPDAPFVTPGAFVAALTQALGNTPAPAAAVAPPPLPTLVPDAPRRKPSAALIFALVALVLIVMLLTGIVWFVVPRLQAALHAGQHTEVPTPTAPPSPTPLVVEATPPPTPTPTATPSAFDTALKRVQELGMAGNYIAAFGTLDDLARDNPGEAVRLREETEKLAAKLRAETPDDTLTSEQLEQLADVLESAAQRGSTSAQMLLGKSYLAADRPADAFKYFYAAATDGKNSEAMYQVGNLYAAGHGTDKDFAKAVEFFQKSADLYYPSAIYALGECYFFGKGVPQNTGVAIKNLQLAAGYDNPQAQNLLGDIARKGLMGKPDYVEAFRLWSRATKQGWLDAQANLGVMYWMGEIIDGKPVASKPDRDKADLKTAVQLWKDGSDKGNASCTYFYALCLVNDGVSGIVDPDEKTGRSLMIKAAEQGNPQARKWCRDHDVKFDSSLR
jgi:serine/threonine protein kinase/TPR repeat protein